MFLDIELLGLPDGLRASSALKPAVRTLRTLEPCEPAVLFEPADLPVRTLEPAVRNLRSPSRLLKDGLQDHNLSVMWAAEGAHAAYRVRHIFGVRKHTHVPCVRRHVYLLYFYAFGGELAARATAAVGGEENSTSPNMVWPCGDRDNCQALDSAR